MSSAPSTKSATPPGHKPTAVRIPLSDPVAEPAPGDSQSTPHAEQTIVAPVVQATAAPTSADLDAQLAADLDAMLQGEFDPIEKVLDEVFDEKAAIVQRAGGLPAERNMSQHGGTVIPATRETIEQLSSRTADAPIPAPAYAVATPPTVAVTMPSQSNAHVPAAMASVSTANTQPVQPEVRVEQTAAASTHAERPREAESPKPVAAASHRAAEQPHAAVASASSHATTATSVSESVVKQSMQTAVMQKREPLRAAQPIVRVLMMLNLPLRKLPRSLRPLMNWAAVTLLLWVPIVWVLAVMNRGAAEHDGDAKSTGGHATDIVLHESSRIDEKVTAQPSTSH